MTKLEYLNKRLETRHIYESDYGVTSSLIHSLSPQDACNFFDLKFEQDYRVRRFVLRKISNDMSKNYLPEHKILLATLIKKLDEKGFRKKESCSYSIDFLYNSLPTKQKGLILKKFLNSKSSRNRDRAFKRLNSNWNKKYQDIIEQVWNVYHDPYCLGIILNHFSIEFLLNNYKDIVQHTEPYQTSKLFLKLGAINFNIINELKYIDQISYAYLLAKFDKKLSKNEAKDILKNNYKDDRIGLLLWCFGQMGLWDSIVEFDSKYKDKHHRAQIEQYMRD